MNLLCIEESVASSCGARLAKDILTLLIHDMFQNVAIATAKTYKKSLWMIEPSV